MPVIQNGDRTASRVGIAGLYKLARGNSTQYLKRTNLRTSFQPMLAYLQSFNVPSRSRSRRAINATVSRASKSTLSGAALAGIIVASLAVLLLLLLSCSYLLKRRRRKTPNTHIVENGLLRNAGNGLGSHGLVTAGFSNDLPPPRILPGHRPSTSQASSVTVVSVNIPTSPSSKVIDIDGKKDESILLPTLPPPLVLRPERTDSLGKVQQPDPVRIEKSKSVKSTKGRGRESVLPNPWESDAKPYRAAFQSMVFKLPPSSIASIRPGLPQTPRERRASLSPEVKPMEIS